MKLTTKHSKITGSKQQGRGDDLPNQDEVPGLGIDNLETIFRNLKVDITALQALRSTSTEMKNIVDRLFILNNYHGLAGVRVILIKTICRLLNTHGKLPESYKVNKFHQPCSIILASYTLCILTIYSTYTETDNTGGLHLFLHYKDEDDTQYHPSTHVYFDREYNGSVEQNNQIIQAMDFIFNHIDGLMNNPKIMNKGEEFRVSDVRIYPNVALMHVDMQKTVREITDLISSIKLTEPVTKRKIDIDLAAADAAIAAPAAIADPAAIAAATATAAADAADAKIFVYVNHDDLIALIQKYRKDTEGTDPIPFSTYLTQLLKALNDQRFKQYNYTNIVTKNVGKGIADIVKEVEKLIPPSQVQPQLEGGNRGSKPKSYKKTADKFKYKKRDYVVYKGTHSGLYIKLDGGYKSVKSITRK